MLPNTEFIHFLICIKMVSVKNFVGKVGQIGQTKIPASLNFSVLSQTLFIPHTMKLMSTDGLPDSNVLWIGAIGSIKEQKIQPEHIKPSMTMLTELEQLGLKCGLELPKIMSTLHIF